MVGVPVRATLKSHEEGFKATGKIDLGAYTLEVVGDAFEDE
jgi:hypothetical protein